MVNHNFKFYYHNRFGWFRLFGIGLKWKDTSIHRLIFSERNGHSIGIQLGKWRIGYLPVFVSILSIVLLPSCVDNTTSTIKRENEAQQRIYGKESTLYKGIGYYIIEVDGVEYIASSKGGICPLI